MADSGKKLQLSEDTILQEACNLTIAGTDTTVVALTYLV
jgi:cytochrome P450